MYNNIKNVCIYLQLNTRVTLLKLVPVLDEAIPACSGHLARLMWMPQNCNAHIVMCGPLAEEFGRFPVPYVRLAVSIT